MKIGIVLNDSAGTIQGSNLSASGIKAMFSSAGVQSDILYLDGAPIEDKVRVLIYKGINAIIAAGGDGTVSTVASAAAVNKIPMGVLPLGTLNHFAKDLQIPQNPEEAVKVIVQNKTTKVDIAEVNGQIFINNSSIGVYPKVVKQRDRRKGEKGNKWIAMIQAFIDVFIKLPVLKVKITSDSGTIYCKTPFVFIGNNEYNFDIFNLGSRTDLTKGYLSIYYPKVSGRLSMFRFFAHALADNLYQLDDFNVELQKEVTIETKQRIIEVSADGEVLHITTPLKYKIRPQDLTVIVP